MNSSLVLAVQRAAHASALALATSLSDDALTPSEINALANLDRPLTVSRLALAAGVRPTTLTSLLDRLEARGLLTRRPAPGDRRALLVELTTRGEEVADRVRSAVEQLESRALGGLAEGQRAELAAALDELAEVEP